MTNNESLEIKRFFELQNIKLSDIWLESCLNWCKDEIFTNNYTQKQLQTQVYEQWLLLDLRDVELAILPLNLSTKKHYILNGIYCLQIMEICDISKPKLWQLQNIRNRNSLTKKYNDQENESNNNNKRMLELVLTDGVQQIQAIEYRPIPFINVNLTPGIKIQLIGPITVRRGRLLLEPHNIKILNGQVEELIITNAAENVLARHLNLPLNPNPQNVEHVENTDEQPQINRNQQIPPPRVVNNQNNNQRIADNDERIIAEEIDILLEAEQSLINGNRNDHQSNPVPSLDDDFFDDIDIDAHLNQVDDVLNRQQSKEPKTNLLTIEKLLQNKNQINKGVFRIKAKFKSIVEKVTMDENEYRLIIKVQDEQMNEIDCKVHSDIITNFAGHYPAALTSLKSNVLQKDPIATEKVLKALQNIKNKIITIDNVLEIQIDRNDELCTIVKIL